MFLELIKSAALLLALGFMQGLVPRLWPKGGTWGLVVSGVIFGFIAVVAMMTPVQLQPGIIFDPRSVIISLAGFVGGPPVAVISAAIAGSYRLWLGGTGALTGTLVIAVCASMGIGYRYINHRYGIATKNWHLLLFGFVVHVAVVLCMFTLPPDIRWSALSRVTLPFLTVFPLITMFLGFFLQDIEDQLKIAKALEESEQRYKGVVEDTPVLICRFLPGGEITYVNDAYCRYFDKTTEALEGSNFLMLIPKEYWEIVMSNINSLTMDMPTQSHEHQVITPDGQHHWQRWVNRALFNQEGKITAYQSMGEDITGRKQAEASLIESEAKYRSIFQSTGVGMIVVIDGNGDIEEWNVGAERAFGYSSAEVAGKPLTMLMPERYREAHTKGFAWAREQGGLAHSGVTHQVHGLRKDGEEFSLELTLGSWKRDGDIFFSAIILDITKRKRAEEKVHTLSQAIEQSPVSVIITDPKANIVFVNNTFEQVTGYSSAEVIGQNPSILKSGTPPQGATVIYGWLSPMARRGGVSFRIVEKMERSSGNRHKLRQC